MSFRMGLSQCGFPGDGNVVAMVSDVTGRAARESCDLLVFPEDLMCPRPLSASEVRTAAEPLDGPFMGQISDIARAQGLWMVITLFEENPRGGAPFNTAAIIDDAGSLRGSYRKCHLYDAHGILESRRTCPGDELTRAIEAPFATLGLGVCYDLRFPEHARSLALAGCDLIVYPSAWYAGPAKAEHWETLLAARAIENEAYVAGVCHAGGKFVGRSLVADPMGRILARAGDGEVEQLLICDVDMDAVGKTRDAMPVLEHRRDDLY